TTPPAARAAHRPPDPPRPDSRPRRTRYVRRRRAAPPPRPRLRIAWAPGRFALRGRDAPPASQSEALGLSKFRCYGLRVKSAAVFPTPRRVPLVARLHVDLCRVTTANCRP